MLRVRYNYRKEKFLKKYDGFQKFFFKKLYIPFFSAFFKSLIYIKKYDKRVQNVYHKLLN